MISYEFHSRLAAFVFILLFSALFGTQASAQDRDGTDKKSVLNLSDQEIDYVDKLIDFNTEDNGGVPGCFAMVGDRCISCKKGMSLNRSENKCYICSEFFEGCVSCTLTQDQQEGICKECKEGYRIAERDYSPRSYCEKCSSGCKLCSETSCISCFPGYELTPNGLCVSWY